MRTDVRPRGSRSGEGFFAIKHLTLRNRVVSTSHEPACSVDGLPTERYIAYHVEKAKGGVGLTMIGGSAVVSPDMHSVVGTCRTARWRGPRGLEVCRWLFGRRRRRLARTRLRKHKLHR